MPFDPTIMAAMFMAEWVADAEGTSHYAHRVRTTDTTPTIGEDGQPIMTLEVWAVCGKHFSVQPAKGQRRCQQCSHMLPRDGGPPQPGLMGPSNGGD